MTTTEPDRIAALRDVEAKAAALFGAAIDRRLIVPGTTELQLSDQIRDLANEMFGVEKFWPKRIVRAGVNTLEPYRSNPPNRTLEDDDILFVDFGPIFEEWEADVDRTYVLGHDPDKHRMAADLPVIWAAGRDYFATHPEITGAQLFTHVLAQIDAAGWGHGAFDEQLLDL